MARVLLMNVNVSQYGKGVMLEVRLGAADLAGRCAAVRRALRSGRLDRRELSALEHELEALLADLAPRWCAAEAAVGPTPEIRLARAALRALEESVSWVNRFRKHAPLRERREFLERGQEGAGGATMLLERVARGEGGPQLASEERQ